MPARHRRPFPWPLFVLLLAGCGVAEYEARMKDAQERIRRYDEESKVLGPGFQPPTAKGESGPTLVAPMFLRLPTGLAVTQSPKSPRDDLYYDYLPASANVFAWVSVAVAKPDDDAAFEANLLKFFSPVTPYTKTAHVTRPPNRPGLPFERIAFEDAANAYSLNVHKARQAQVAILYAVPKAQARQAARTIDLSLESFGIEGSLQGARDAFRPSSLLEVVPK